MFRQMIFVLVLLSVLVCSACSAGQGSPTSQAGLANPASVYCEQHGGKVEMRTSSDGGVVGICVFTDGSECDEWAYFRGECKPGSGRMASQATVVTGPTRSAPKAELAADGCKVYRNRALGYSFHYPSEATISTADDPLRTLTIEGPLVGNEHWPVIYVSHPGDREDYRPPEGVNLEKWLTEHNLLMADGKNQVRQPDLQIVGTPAIHTRLARSSQSFASDRYYFARAQQLYSIVILHTGDKQDWTLYNHFLTSIQFE